MYVKVMAFWCRWRAELTTPALHCLAGTGKCLSSLQLVSEAATIVKVTVSDLYSSTFYFWSYLTRCWLLQIHFFNASKLLLILRTKTVCYNAAYAAYGNFLTVWYLIFISIWNFSIYYALFFWLFVLFCCLLVAFFNLRVSEAPDFLFTRCLLWWAAQDNICVVQTECPKECGVCLSPCLSWLASLLLTPLKVCLSSLQSVLATWWNWSQSLGYSTETCQWLGKKEPARSVLLLVKREVRWEHLDTERVALLYMVKDKKGGVSGWIIEQSRAGNVWEHF